MRSEIHSFFLGGSIKILQLEDIISSYHLDEKGERDIINRFGIETEDSGEILIRVNVISCNQERKKVNRDKYEIQKEYKKQELHKVIMNERIKHIKKKKVDNIHKGVWEDLEEESDANLSDDSYGIQQHVVTGVNG